MNSPIRPKPLSPQHIGPEAPASFPANAPGETARPSAAGASPLESAPCESAPGEPAPCARAESASAQPASPPPIALTAAALKFREEVLAEPGGEHLLACYACGTCTAGCPVREADERYNPRRIIRMVLLGMREEVLRSDFLWFCSTCYTCTERCPQGVHLTTIMRALKNIAVRSGIVPAGYRMQVQALRANGKLYEIEDFDNKKRARMGLPELEKKCPDVAALILEGDLKNL